MSPEAIIALITILLTVAYAYANGMNDAANAIATVISTRVLSPFTAIVMGAVMNFIGALSGTAVAKTIGKGIIDPDQITQATVMAAVLAAVIWVFVATRFGYPVSVSHSLVAGVLGAGIATAGFAAVNTATIQKVMTALALSPIFGIIGGFIFMTMLYWVLRNRRPAWVSSVFGKLQVVSAVFMAFSHGKNDGQNAMGMIALAYAVYQSPEKPVVEIVLWMQILGALAIFLGTAVGGWRVIQTIGMRVTLLRPVHGFAAETVAGGIIEGASTLGLPVSTTHTIGSSIVGVGATRRLSAVRWGITRNIVLSWIVTYPACFGMALVISYLLGLFLDPVIASPASSN